MRHLLELLLFAAVFLAGVALLQRYGNEDLLQVFLSFAIMAPLVYLVVDRFAQGQRLARMKQAALRAELASLESQIDPHFFFNTLNNLYGLTRAKSERAPEMILTLSDLMRFTIYEGRKRTVPIEDEVAYLESYLRLMSIRAHMDKVAVSFRADVVDEQVAVPPLMLVIPVENAFKHGAASLTEGAFIDILLQVDKRTLSLSVTNNYDPAAQKKEKGIGLENLRRRLALRYPGRHALALEAEEGLYRAKLRIDL